MTATTSETGVAETTEDTPEPLTFEQLQRAIWLTARSQWDGLESDQERVEQVYSWCSGGVNEALSDLRLPGVHDDVAYFDAWQAWHNEWELNSSVSVDARVRHLGRRVRQFLENSSSMTVATKNAWLTSWGLEELPKPTTRGTVTFRYTVTDDTGAILAAIQTALEPWNGDAVRWY